MAQWLQAGNVIYKSVGLGLMDLTVGLKVVEFARAKGAGTHVEGF
jgi:ornithine cyclodeaminase/alanine dehydrogenase-like protein (mu-crystallin family)